MTKIDPAFVHVAAALTVQALVSTPLAFLGYPEAFIWMAIWVFGFYAGRERRQAETGAGSNRILPWDFSGNPDGWRQMLYPALATAALAAGIMLA